MRKSKQPLNAVENALQRIGQHDGDPEANLIDLANQYGRSQDFSRISDRDLRKLINRFLHAAERVGQALVGADAAFRQMVDDVVQTRQDNGKVGTKVAGSFLCVIRQPSDIERHAAKLSRPLTV